MTSTEGCANCKKEISAEWSTLMPDKGTYTFCPFCEYLYWTFPPELTPFQQEGFPTSFVIGGELSPDKAELFLSVVRAKLEEFGYSLDFELSDWVNDDSADLSTQWASLEGTISGTIQDEKTSWPYDPNDEDSEGNEREVDRLSPEYLNEIIVEALEEMVDNFGSDGWESTRGHIRELLNGITYDGKPVEVEVGPGYWTGKG